MGHEVCPICSSTASLRCSSCKEVSYCSKEHQRMDWKNHKNSCKAYEVKTSKDLGRYLVATRDLNPGDIIISETPIIFAPKALYDPEMMAPCVGCYRPVNLDIGERCPNCSWPICSGHCPGLKDQRHHGLECVVLSLRSGCAVSNMGDYYRHDALMALRCLISQKRFPKRYKKIMELESHMNDRKKGTEIYKETDSFIVKYLENNFLHALRAVETELKTSVVPEISSELIHQICGIIDVNALEITLNNGSQISALYHTSCMMEHSCFPNTKHRFNIDAIDEDTQFRIMVKAVRPIKKGENITTMYTHALWGTHGRRDHLMETKYFSCSCKRCKDPTELNTYLSAMNCIGTETVPCGGIQLPEDPCNSNSDWCCNKCPVKIKTTEVRYLTAKLGEEVENIQAGHPTITQLEDLLKKLSTFLHPNHFHVYAVKHSLVQLYGHQSGYLHYEMSTELLEKKIEMCNGLLDVTLALDPGNSRLNLYSGVLYHELFQAKFEMLKRNARSMSFPDRMSGKEEIKKCLKNALLALEDENEGSPGWRLTLVIRESEKKFSNWCKEN